MAATLTADYMILSLKVPEALEFDPSVEDLSVLVK
jgi:hypothetical protein